MPLTVIPSPVSRPRQARATLIAACILFCAFPHVARADLKVITQVDVSGLSGTAFSQTIVTYYQDTKARTDIDGGLITLFDPKTVTVMDPEKKTYYVTTVKKWQQQQRKLSGGMTDRLQLNTKLDLSLADAPYTERVNDLSAKRYLLTGSIDMKLKDEGFGGGGMGGGPGGFPGGGGGSSGPGGFPGGGGGRPDAGNMRMGLRLPKTKIDGEVWLSDTITLPSVKKFTSMPSAIEMAFSAGPIVKALSQKVDKIGFLPLYSKITVTRFEPSTETSQDGLYRTTQSIVTTVKVTSVSQEPIDASRFQVPDDYQKIDPPSENITNFSEGKNDDRNILIEMPSP